MAFFRRFIQAYCAKPKVTVPKATTTSSNTKTTNTTNFLRTLSPPKHIGIIVEMDSNYPLFKS